MSEYTVDCTVLCLCTNVFLYCVRTLLTVLYCVCVQMCTCNEWVHCWLYCTVFVYKCVPVLCEYTVNCTVLCLCTNVFLYCVRTLLTVLCLCTNVFLYCVRTLLTTLYYVCVQMCSCTVWWHCWLYCTVFVYKCVPLLCEDTVDCTALCLCTNVFLYCVRTLLTVRRSTSQLAWCVSRLRRKGRLVLLEGRPHLSQVYLLFKGTNPSPLQTSCLNKSLVLKWFYGLEWKKIIEYDFCPHWEY